MHTFALYIRYAFRSFKRGRSRSVFGAFCVSVGIASVVALGLTSGNFQSATTRDALKQNRGDLQVTASGLGFSPKNLQLFATLKAKGQIIDYTERIMEGAAYSGPDARNSSAIGTIYTVEPSKFPYYDTIVADQPAGASLKTLLANPANTVVTHDMLATLRLHVGSKLTVVTQHGFTHSFTIAGVVPDEAFDPAFGTGLFNDLAMVNITAMRPFFTGLNIAASTVYVKTSSPAQASAVKRIVTQTLPGFPTAKTVADVARDNKNEAKGFDKFFSVMGLVAVVIGGIGIINTMLVAARRRTKEIAALKTLGMKGRQVIIVFTLESLFLGLSGAIAGVLAGIGASMLVNNITAGIAGYAIPWTWQTRPIVAGALVGVVATVLFSYLPVLIASRARPVTVLRGDSGAGTRTRRFRALLRNLRSRPLGTVGSGLRRAPGALIRVPTRQGFRTFLVVIALAALTGYLSMLYAGIGSGTQTVILGALAGIVTLIVAAVVIQLFVASIWGISHLPSFGRLSLRMALRNMRTQKRRLASTLLALCVGVLAMGTSTILAQNLKSFASQQIATQKLNVVIQTPQNPATAARVDREVARLPGVERHDRGAVVDNATLVTANGENVMAALQRKVKANKLDSLTLSNVLWELRGLEARDERVANYSFIMKAGHNLSQRDVGTNHIVINEDVARALDITVGARLVFQDGSRRIPFVLVGTTDSGAFSLMASNHVDLTYLQRAGLAAPSASHFSTTYLDIRPDLLTADLAALRQHLPGVMVLDLHSFLSTASKVIDKLVLFPEVIAALSLFAGVVIIANTVALAMIERRREIGVMKAVGAKRRSILQFLLVENAIVGFLGALAGVRLAMLITQLVDENFLKISPSYDWTTIGALLALGVVLAVAASALTALPASGEKPMTVLRHE
jgi:putative ABC transport system permease protein